MSQGFVNSQSIPFPLPVALGGTGVITSTGTGVLVLNNAPNIIGVTNGSNAAAGSVGEFISSFISSASQVAMTSSTPTNITSISLTAGDWDVFGNVYIIFSVTGTAAVGWISTTSATLPDGPLFSGISVNAASIVAGAPAIPFVRLSLAGTTTVYLSAYGAGTVTINGSGGIYARRVR